MEREEGGPDAALALYADWPRQIGGAASAGTARARRAGAPKRRARRGERRTRRRAAAPLVHNVARLVKPPEHTPRERETWSKAEVRKFLAKASSDRLHVAWRLSLYGLRRGEVLGLRWSDIDLRAGMLTVNLARVLVEYRVRIEEPKSRNGKRTLPLDGELVAALTALVSASWKRARSRARSIGQDSLSWSGTRGAST
jgi:integrase